MLYYNNYTNVKNTIMSYHAWPDRFGMIIAVGCAAHCATITVMFLLYPALWLNRRYWEIGLWQKLLWLEWSLLGATWVLVALAMTWGWRQHRRSGPATLATVALLCLSLLILTPLHFSGRWTALLAMVAGLAIAGSHFWNLRAARHNHSV